jgi:hypothetical protein
VISGQLSSALSISQFMNLKNFFNVPSGCQDYETTIATPTATL